MGKAANNEKLKLHATFCNNLAVGIFLAVIVVPSFVLYASSDPILDAPVGPVNFPEMFYLLCGVVLGLSAVIGLRLLAIIFLERIQD